MRVIILTIVTDFDINFSDLFLDGKLLKIFQFMTFHTKLQSVQNNYVLGSIR